MNDSGQDQQNTFRAERTTKSQAQLTVQEGVCLPVNGVHVPLPERCSECQCWLSCTADGVQKRPEKLGGDIEMVYRHQDHRRNSPDDDSKDDG